MAYFYTCPNCGCNLDPGEKCGCKSEAANREDRIDEALKRRFYLKHEMVLFDGNERIEMALKFINDVGIEYDRNRLIEYSRVKRTQAEIIKFATQMVIEKILEFEEE